MTAVLGEGARHAALLYRSPEELVATAVPFLADGLAAGEAVVLGCREENSALLAGALGNDECIVSLPRERVCTRSAEAVATYRRAVHRQVAAGAAGVRLVGEAPADHATHGWAEWHRYEAVFNVVMAPLPLACACAYDARALPRPVQGRVGETHRALLTAGGPVRNDRYVDPATMLRRAAAVPVHGVEDTEPTLDVAGVDDSLGLPHVRERVRAALDGSPEPRCSDFGLAVGEVLTPDGEGATGSLTLSDPPIVLVPMRGSAAMRRRSGRSPSRSGG
jgi:hypothetical protein